MFPSRYFTKLDWISFAVATSLAELVYLFTLTPEIGLRNDGYSATAALYAGIEMPAGFPIWTTWSWLFVKCLPFGSIGWRFAFATSLSAALACGVIALLVARSAVSWLETIPHANLVRLFAGVGAGLAFGFNGALWRQAVVPDPWAMTNLLLCLTIAFSLRWTSEPSCRHYLYLAFFSYGLTLTNSQICLALLPAVPVFVLLFDVDLGRDMFLAGAIAYTITLCRVFPHLWSNIQSRHESAALHFIGIIALLMGSLAAFRTRRAFNQWRSLLLCLASTVVGLAVLLELPLVGMSNPPANWGYPRTVEGFAHVITRGQYDQISMTSGLPQFLLQIGQYLLSAGQDFGWPCLLGAVLPFCFWRQLTPPQRKTLFALLSFYIVLAILMLAVLNPTRDLQSSNLVRLYFSASYIPLAIFLGQGLALLARWIHSLASSKLFSAL